MGNGPSYGGIGLRKRAERFLQQRFIADWAKVLIERIETDQTFLQLVREEFIGAPNPHAISSPLPPSANEERDNHAKKGGPETKPISRRKCQAKNRVSPIWFGRAGHLLRMAERNTFGQ